MPQMSQLTSASPGETLQQARSQQVLQQLKTDGATDHQKLEHAARSFEAILLDRWLEQAEQSFAKVPGEDPDNSNDNPDGDPGAGQFRSLGIQTLAEQIANHGGIGIASMIIRQMEAHHSVGSAQPTDSTPVTPESTKVSSPGGKKIKVSQEKGR
ncbi:MAG TPA: rod-binding protein [Terriglobales bacterium]|nr:rod-binding protein [Terriglobales bacterium]